MLNFALCTDKNYLQPSLVCIVSVFENHKEEECTFYILAKGLDDESQKKFHQLAEKYSQTVHIETIEEGLLADLKTIDRYPTSVFYRFLLPQIVKADKVLYLDVDTIVCHNLHNIFDADLRNYACGVVLDQNCDSVKIANRLQIGTRIQYFNSGVMMMNLSYWREYNITQQLFTFIKRHPEKCIYPDQDALNYVLKDKVSYLPFSYNFQESWYKNLADADISYIYWDDIIKEKENPSIIHFNGPIKPWYKECIHPQKREYYKYAALLNENIHNYKRYYSLFYRIAFKFCYSPSRALITQIRK